MFPVAGTVPLQLKRGVAGLPDLGLGRDRRMTEPGGDLFQELEPVASLVGDRGVLDSVLSQSPIERAGGRCHRPNCIGLRYTCSRASQRAVVVKYAVRGSRRSARNDPPSTAWIGAVLSRRSPLAGDEASEQKGGSTETAKTIQEGGAHATFSGHQRREAGPGPQPRLAEPAGLALPGKQHWSAVGPGLRRLRLKGPFPCLQAAARRMKESGVAAPAWQGMDQADARSHPGSEGQKS